MRCQALVRPHKRGKKAKLIVCPNYDPSLMPDDWSLPDLTGTEVCGGEIVPNIHAEDYPGWGDHYAELCVDSTCKRCGNTIHMGLPTKWNINEFMTDLIAKMEEK